MNEYQQNNTRMTFELPILDHKKLKSIAALQGISLKTLIFECLKENILKENEVNQETINVFKDTDSRKNLIFHKNVEEFLDDLGIK